ncbi:MAG: glycosyltransferase family 4 protein [Pseudomonadota bacterium]
MRILIPLLSFAPQGGYRVLSELANAWRRQAHDCVFLVPSTSGDPYFPTTAPILRADKTGRFSAHPSERAPSGLDNILSLFSGLQKIGPEYDVILANHSLTAWPVSLARTGKARKFYYVQAYEPEYYKFWSSPIKNVLSRMSYLLPLRQISNSSTYDAVGLKPLDVIPPGIDLSIFAQRVEAPRFSPSSEIVLGTIGRVEPHKGTGTALAAYRLLRAMEPHLKMNVGFGNVAPDSDITITPINGDAALAAYYRSVDILVVACRGQHGAPHYPLIEAMASGTPVVHTGYYPGTSANSWIAEDASTEALAIAIRQVIDASDGDRADRIHDARRTVEDGLAWDVVADRFIGCFRR